MIYKGCGRQRRGPFKVWWLIALRGNEENNEISHSEYSMLRPRFEYRRLQLQTWNLIALANLLASLDLNPRISSSHTQQLTLTPQGVYCITWKLCVTKKVSDSDCHLQTQRTHSKFTAVAYCTNDIVCSLKTAKMSRKNPRLSWRVRLCLLVARWPYMWVRRLSTVTSFTVTARKKNRSYLFLETRYLGLFRTSKYVPFWVEETT